MNAMTPLATVKRALAGLLLAWLAGCGPTGGGTGTGGDSVVPLSEFGATAASLCSSPFSDRLDCTGAGLGSAGPSQLPGTATVVFVSSGDALGVSLTLQGDRAELVARCTGARFDGSWGLLPSGEGRFFGLWQASASGTVQRAQALVRATADGGLQWTVVDAAGSQVLLGPVGVRRSGAGAVEPARCPGSAG